MLSVPHGTEASPAAGRLPPRITPIRRQLDNRNRDLSFSIDTDNRPFYRVLLATNRELFAGARAGQRSARNFHDSMGDGMLPFDGRHTHYLVPRSVLRALLPAPEIFYTIIAYDDQAGKNPAYPMAPEELARSAPSVVVAADFRAEGLGFVLATAVENLTSAMTDGVKSELRREVGEDEGEPSVAAAAYAQEEGDATPPPVEPELERAAAEDDYDDGFGAGAALAEEEPGEDTDEPARASAYDAVGGQALSQEPEDYDDGFGTAAAAADSGVGDDQPAYYRSPEATGYGAALDEGNAPLMLYDEEADSSAKHAGAAGEGASLDPDAVEIADDRGTSSTASGFAADDFGESYAAEPAPSPFDVEARKAILARIAPFESGEAGFARIGADTEFEGGYGTKHPAYRRYHLGLTFGAFPFVQENGTLGQLLQLMQERDSAAFVTTFGPRAGELIALATAPGPHASQSPDGMSPRLRPLEGAPLWREPWLARFRQAAANPRFQGAQNELAARLFIEPVLPFARNMGLTSAKCLTLLVDRAVQMGPMGAKQWVAEAADPVPTHAQSQQALASLGHADLASFQKAASLQPTGEWDADTRAALVAALRASGRSPVPLPQPQQLADAIVRRAVGTPWEERTRRLATAPIQDVVYQL